MSLFRRKATASRATSTAARGSARGTTAGVPAATNAYAGVNVYATAAADTHSNVCVDTARASY
ncbi:MAG: hypothetical protein KJ947_22435 [Alphaproteobacteria bacterium]|nr:hypothetical protein [Alphaproteobacteria bacterium]MBU1552306.1 hypothetical protein [Alphaproteobacteria bacterium]MBU2336795.1 hypothetical protein [Alphaproteobacteria bacterium]MBU2388476.1 hypothetical protein [Alphaproteobacteria bacterium]